MLFNSLTFLVFFAVFYNIYLHLRPWRRVQNALLLVASYVFYGWWDWRFLGLLALSTVIDFIVAARLARTEGDRARRTLLAVSVVTNLGILGFFKYFNFFADGLSDLAGLVGLTLDRPTLDIVLPVGISFYTFQTLSYTIDVYRRRLEPTRSLLDFAVFVAFFPQLVAGPIERAKQFLPQVARPREISASQMESGVYLILWGLFKKVVIADNAAIISDQIFNHATQYQGLDLLAGALAFTLQIYGDFSGYTDIARGLARLMGFELMVNFRLPYFARTPSDFWQRWHVSLSSWLRDYLYISLGGNRGGSWRTYRNLMLTMLLGGLWHGAAWHFVYWGAWHGAILVIYRALGITHDKPRAPGAVGVATDVAQWAVMFALTVIGWILFRAADTDQILWFFKHLGFTSSPQTSTFLGDVAFLWAPLWAMQIWQFARGDLLVLPKTRLVLRAPLYALLVCGILIYGSGESQEFIYFQF